MPKSAAMSETAFRIVVLLSVTTSTAGDQSVMKYHDYTSKFVLKPQLFGGSQ
jgi:hypothetical protein